jgi:hypothetical protein
MNNHTDFAHVLEQSDDPAVGKAVLGALNKLFERDPQLLELDAKEESIAFHFARYLQPHFPDRSVDFEYDRMGGAPKTVTHDEKPQRVYPDVIVHIRNNQAAGIPNNAANLLAIELKKDTNPEAKARDIGKLRAYRHELEYRHALFLRFGTREFAGTITECEWVDA